MASSLNNVVIISPSFTPFHLLGHIESAAAEAGDPLPFSSAYDIGLFQLQKRGVADETGRLKKTPDTLPPFSIDQSRQFVNFFYSVHQALTNDSHPFLLSIPQLIFAALQSFGISSYSPCLVGGAVFAFIDKEYIKSVLDQLDPGLFGALPKECFEMFGAVPNDYDFRVYMHAKLNFETFQLLKNKLISIFTQHFSGPAPRLEEWTPMYTYVKDNCFQKLKVVYNQENKFLITSFAGSQCTYDIIWIEDLDVDYLFLCNSLKLYIPRNGTTITPFGEVANGYQAILDKMMKIIHANTIKENNFKAWFCFLNLHAAFYRSYEKGLEKKTLLIALKHLKSESDPVKALKDHLQLCLIDHVDSEGDAAAKFCLNFSACRSMHLLGDPQLASQLYAGCCGSFPKTGLPALFLAEDPIETHLALLQLFGLFSLDGSTICYTIDQFEPALQFVVAGQKKSFTLLVPLDLDNALNTLLKNRDNEIISRYFAHFFSHGECRFSPNSLKQNIPANLLLLGLSHEDPLVRRLFHYLAIWSDAFQHMDLLLAHFVPASAHQKAITEKFLQRLIKCERLSLPKEGDICDLVKALFRPNHPLLSLKAFELWKRQSGLPGFREKTLDLIETIPNPAYQIKLFKLIPSYDQLGKLFSLLAYSFNQAEGPSLLTDFVKGIVLLPDPAPPSAIPILNSLLELYLSKFGFQSEAFILIAKIGAEAKDLFLKEAKQLDPAAAKKAWERVKNLFDPKEETAFYGHLIIRFTEQNEYAEAIALLASLNRDLLDKRLEKRLLEAIEKLKLLPKLGAPVVLSEVDRLIKKKEWTQAVAQLIALINQNPENKEEVRARILKLPNLPERLLLKIDPYLTPDEYIQAITPMLSAPLLEIGIERFPAQSEELNRKFIAQIIAKNLNRDSKITPYVIALKDAALIEAWVKGCEKLPEEELENYLKLLDPNASPTLRKFTAKSSLENISEAYAAYIPHTGKTEMAAWITLILEAKAAHLYPLISWMEKTGPQASHLSLCRAQSFSDEAGLKNLLTALPIRKQDLSLLIPLYTHFKLLTPSVIASFAIEADLSVKNEVLALFQQFSDQIEDLKAWQSAINLLDDERLFSYIEGTTPFPGAMAAEIASGAVRLIKNGETKRIQQLLVFRDKHNLGDDAPFLTLYASTEPLLALERLITFFPKKPKESLLILEKILKSKEQAEFDTTLQALLPNIPLNELNNASLLLLLRLLLTAPKEFALKIALDLVLLLLENKVENVPSFGPCLELAIRSSKYPLHEKALLCVNHPLLPRSINKTKIGDLKIELIEQMLSSCKQHPAAIQETFNLFHDNYLAIAKSPSREKKCLYLAVDAFFKIPNPPPNSLITFFYKLMLKIQATQSVSKQMAAYFFEMEMLKIPVDKLPSNPHDLFFAFSVLLLNKINDSDIAYLDSNHDLFEFAYSHLHTLFIAYKENTTELIPALYKFALLQLPSGYDISPEMLENKWKLLSTVMINQQNEAPDSEDFAELCYLCIDRFIYLNFPLEFAQKQFKKVLFRLFLHPSPAGVAHAITLISQKMELFQPLDDKTLLFMLKSLSQAVIKDPFYQIETENLIQDYANLLFLLSLEKRKLVETHLEESYPIISKALEERYPTRATEVLQILASLTKN